MAAGAGITGADQAPILTVTLNPALDLSTSAEQVVPDIKLRCEAPAVDPGGGGINVSRAISRIGGRSTALVALGGGTGTQLGRLLNEAGLPVLRINAPGDTRQSLSVTDRTTEKQFRFVLPGPEWAAADVADALDAVAAAAVPGSIVVLSGSNPPGVPDDFVLRLCARLRGRPVRLLMDSSGAALALAARGKVRLAVLRMDDAEAEGLAGRKLPERRDTADFASALVAAGAAQTVVIARGADGNIAAGPDGRWHVEAHRVPIVSKIGAGDSFVAGYALAIARGRGVAEALGLGAACASATCMMPGTGLCRPDDVMRLYQERVVTPI
ncbi:6-phosphofructokinase [Paracoccus solventivorans]|uniref:Phosphofructokinase n=1 Tax=Paracoccus solventivorans TaxID=53463 RepID=A0A1M7DP52_9RHOB|nr:hexose kinase [Paracoccus solventivorans]SHL81245.1 6-phosphofructokinase [Paracoccus solventivorans]